MWNNKHEAITCSAMQALIMVITVKERSASRLYPSENGGKPVTLRDKRQLSCALVSFYG